MDGLPGHEPDHVVDQVFDVRTPEGIGIHRQRIHPDFGMIDLAAAVPGLGHEAEGNDRESQRQIQHLVREALQVPVPPELEIGGDTGCCQTEQRNQRHVAVGIDCRLRNAARHVLQRPHGRRACDIGRRAEDAENREQDQAHALQAIIIRHKGGDEECQRQRQANSREVVHDDVDMRPVLRSHLLRRVEKQFGVVDFPALFARDRHQQQCHAARREHDIASELSQITGGAVLPQLISRRRTHDHQRQQRDVANRLVPRNHRRREAGISRDSGGRAGAAEISGYSERAGDR